MRNPAAENQAIFRRRRCLGASQVFDYRSAPFPPKHASSLGSGPFDLVFDAIGMHSLSSCASLMSPRGRYVTTVPNGRNLVSAVRSRLLPLGRRSSVVLVKSNAADLRQIGLWMEAGSVRSHLDRVEPLGNVRALHEHSRTFRTRGKNVIAIREEACGG